MARVGAASKVTSRLQLFTVTGKASAGAAERRMGRRAYFVSVALELK
jgi:hypothetical protein